MLDDGALDFEPSDPPMILGTETADLYCLLGRMISWFPIAAVNRSRGKVSDIRRLPASRAGP